MFANALQDAGHEVQVITGFPNYPGGRVYEGYRVRWLQRENPGAVEIFRVPLYPSHDGSRIGRVLNYVTFAAAAFLAGLFLVRRPDVIYAYHPPLTTAMAATGMGFFRRVPVVCDIQDLWPDTLRATGMIGNPRLLGFVGWLCSRVYRRAKKIVVLSPGFRSKLVERGVAEEKMRVIYNWCNEAAMAAPTIVEPEKFGMQERFNVLFAGTMGPAQALDAVIEAARLVGSADPRVQFVFVGGGVDRTRLEKLAARVAPENTRFLPRMPMDRIGQVLAAADVLLVHLRDDELFRVTIPSKTQAYMAAGKAVLMAVNGDAADLVRKAQAGLCTEPGDPAALARTVLRLAGMPSGEREQMGRRGQAFYRDELSLQSGVKQFIDVFHEAIGNSPR